jgi:hypothetical protein
VTRGLLFWILILLWLLFGLFAAWPITGASVVPLGGNLLLFVVIVLLGWQAFGPPIHG